MKQDLKESMQFILQHPAIGSPLVQHAQNLARHITLEHYSVPAEPQVTDEQTVRELRDAIKSAIEFAERTGRVDVDVIDLSRWHIDCSYLLLSAPPVASYPDVSLCPACLTEVQKVAPQEAEQVAWWNGLRRYNEREDTHPSFRESEDMYHDIPVFAETNPCNLAVPQEPALDAATVRNAALEEVAEWIGWQRNSVAAYGEEFAAAIREHYFLKSQSKKIEKNENNFE